VAVSAPLVFQGRLNLEDVTQIQRYHGRVLLRRPLRWLAGLFATALAALCAGAMFVTGPHPVSIAVIVAWFWLILLPWERRWWARRHYRRHPEEYLETRVTLTEDWICVDNEAQRSEFQWKLVGLVCDTPKGLLFCDRTFRALFWLPARLFEGNQLREDVLGLAAQNDATIRRLS